MTVPPDPNNPEAVQRAADLIARGQIVRLNPGEIVTVRPGRFQRYGIAYAVNRLTSAERDWLVEYQRAAKAQRRADREAEREARRARMRGES